MNQPRTSLLSGRERLVLFAIVAAAAVLRFGGLAEQSLSHFDEGVYMASAATTANGGPYKVYFQQPLYAPPLLPWMIAPWVWLTQSSWPGFGLMTTAALGVASVPLLYRLARRWGGESFGLTAAALLAISDLHVVYSRMVLTDAPLTFWFLLAMYGVVRLLESFAPTPSAPVGPRSRDRKAKSAAPRAPLLSRFCWTAVVALAGAAAWNTKYNGWMILAIALAALVAAVIRTWLIPVRWRELNPATVRIAGPFVWLLAASAVAGLCYLPWYWYVEREFAGGYAAVTANHRSYFGGMGAWPRNAWTMLQTLPALRHGGWVASLGAAAVGAVAFWRSPLRKGRTPLLVCLALAWIPLVVYGLDAILFIAAPAAIVWCVLAGGWERILPAAWCAAFLVGAPLYHPYQRLLTPALPAAICVVLWLVRDAYASAQAGGLAISLRAPRAALLASSAAALVAAGGWHPFGWLPYSEVWARHSCRQSYRALEAELAKTDQRSVAVLLGQPVMLVYSPREPVVIESKSFVDTLDRISSDRDCYLAVDFLWLYQPGESAALPAFQAELANLTPVAIVQNDVSIVTLLDRLGPTQIVQKLTGPQPPREMAASDGRSVAAPPDVGEPFADTIVLYRVKRRPAIDGR